MKALVVLYYYSSGGNFIFPILILVFALIRLIIRLTKNSSTPNRSVPPNPYQQNPYNPNQPFPQADNPFVPNPPSVPNPYGNNQFVPPQNDAFNQQNDAFNQQTGQFNQHTNNPFAPQADQFETFHGKKTNEDPNAVYCMYCGKRFSSVDLLLKDTCFKHPKSELGLQKHVLYRGVGKPNVGF
ncbi:MAG TPA: hypothetical protein VL651_02965 [Bacteroidia bacterium]|jgi:hypothetical protein|nr:hypothetical protein [Bacteroidia bacterium]